MADDWIVPEQQDDWAVPPEPLPPPTGVERLFRAEEPPEVQPRIPEAFVPPVRFVPQGVPRERLLPATAEPVIAEPLPPSPFDVPIAPPEGPSSDLPGFWESLWKTGVPRVVQDPVETAEMLANRLQGKPLAERTERVTGVLDPRVAEIKPSEAFTDWNKFKAWAGHMLGQSAPAAIAAMAAGRAGPLAMMGASGLAQFVADYGPKFRENVEAGMPEDQALRLALKQAGVTATTTGISFGLPMGLVAQILGQPSVGIAEQMVQNYLVGKPALEDVEEAAIAGAAGAVPAVAAHGVGKLRRKPPAAAEAQPPAAEAPPPGETPPPAAERVVLGEEGAAAHQPPPAEGPPAPAAAAAAAPQRAGPAVPPDLFDWVIRGEEGEPPPAAAAQPPAAVEPPPSEAGVVEVRGPVPRVAPRVEPPPARVEPPPRAEPPPSAAPNVEVRENTGEGMPYGVYVNGKPAGGYDTREAAQAAADRIGARREPPPRVEPPDDFFVPMEEPPARVTEQVPEYAVPAPPPEPVEAAPPPETPAARARREAEARRAEREAAAARPPEEAAPPVEPAPGRAPETINRETYVRPGERVDMRQVAADVTGRVDQALARGDRVTYFVQDKPVEITGVTGGMMTDARGQRWGVMDLLSPTPGKRSEIEIAPRAAPAPAPLPIPALGKPKKGEVARKRQSLAQFIQARGGISTKDPMISDARAVLGGRVSPLIRKDGIPLDRMREAAAEAGYFPMEGTTVRDLLDHLDRDVRARAAKDDTGRVYPRGEELGGRRPGEYEQAVEQHARTIREAFEQDGLAGELETDVMYRAAQILYDGAETDPHIAYSKAALEQAEIDAGREAAAVQRERVRAKAAEVPEAGEPGAGPRPEEALPARRREVAEPGAARRPAGAERPRPRHEVSADDVALVKKVFRDEVGIEVDLPHSVPLRTALAELDLSHLKDVPAQVARFVSKRLANIVGDTPVHFVDEASLQRLAGNERYFTKPGEGGIVHGYFLPDQPRPFILMNADAMWGGPKANVAWYVLHEGTHVASHINIERNPQVKRSIRVLMDHLEPRLKTESGRKHYSLTDEHEFISEVFSNPQLQEVLHRVETPPAVRDMLKLTTGKLGSAWDAMVEIVRRLIGLPPKMKTQLDMFMRTPGHTLLETALTLGTEATRAREAAPAAVARRAVEERQLTPEQIRLRIGQISRDVARRGREGYDTRSEEFARERNELRRLRDQLQEATGRRRIEEEPGAEGKPQTVMPGMERRVGEALQRRAEAPLRPKAEQKPADFGLFGTEKDQPDLFGRIRDRKAVVSDAANEALSDRLILHNHQKLSKVSGYLGGTKANPTELRVKMQDKFLRWKQVIEQWHRDHPGQALPEELDVYTIESLSHGKIDNRISKAERDYIDPLIKEMVKRDVTWDEAGEYLQALHAPERNAELRKINKNIADPAGMSDADAAAIVRRVQSGNRRADFDAVAQAVRRLVDETLDMQVADGLITPQLAGMWKQRWPNYVPMRHSETGGSWMGVGKGIEVRGKESMRAFGRLSRAENPIAFALEQMQRAIVRGEHNRVGQAAGDLVRAYPESDFWSTTERPTVREIDPKTGQVTTRVPHDWRERPDVFTWKENGKEQSIWFKDKDYGAKLVRALKNLEVKQMSTVVRGMARTTRLLAQLSTTLNPNFIPVNFVRDVGGVLLSLQAEEQRGLTRSFLKNLAPAMKGALRGQWPTGGGKYAQFYREFQEAGGQVGYLGAKRVETLTADVKSKLRKLQGGPINSMIRWANNTRKAIDTASTMVENATRLSVYVSAREHGYSKQRAASLARESSINFNRSGEMGRSILPLYMFANAGLQGTARMAQMLQHKKVRRAVYAMAAAGTTLALYNILAGGEDKDGRSKYSKITPWDRQTNFILMSPDGSGSHIKIPKPFGYGLFSNIGENLASHLYDNQKPSETVGAIWDSIVSAFDPLGHDENRIAHFLPTLFKPMAHLYTGVGPFGLPVRPDDMPWNKYLPKAERRQMRGTSPFSIEFAKTLNRLSGGDQKTPGALDVSPGEVDYVLGFVTGGLGRFGMDMLNSATRVYRGQEWLPEKTPVARRFYGEAPQPGANRKLYYDERKEVMAAKQRETKGPELNAWRTFKDTDKLLSDLRKQEEALNAKDLPAAKKDKQLKALEERGLKAMLEARRALERSRAAAEKRKPSQRFAGGGIVNADSRPRYAVGGLVAL